MAIMIRFLFALGVIALAGPAAAQSKLSPFDPARIEFATPTTQSATCLSNRKDGICTAQAIIACATFSRRAECADFPRLHKFSNPQGWTRLEYRIIDAGIVSREAVREFDRANNRLRFVPLSGLAYIEPGILQVRIFTRKCGPGADTCDGTPWYDSVVVLKRAKGRWSHVSVMSLYRDEWLAGPLSEPSP